MAEKTELMNITPILMIQPVINVNFS